MTASASGRTRTAPWAQRADAAESAVMSRHVRRLWAVPWTRLGRVAWPADVPAATFVEWRHGWQVHLLHCAVDAAVRAPSPQRRRRLGRLARTPRLRGIFERLPQVCETSVVTGLALERAARLCDVRAGASRNSQGGGKAAAASTLRASIVDGLGMLEPPPEGRADSGSGDAAALNGAAGLLLARLGDTETAAALADRIHETLCDTNTGLVAARPDADEPAYPAHCQGFVLGLETQLARDGGDPRHARRARRLIAGAGDGLCTDGVIRGGGGGDAGLGAGILVRYLADAACVLPERTAEDAAARGEAARLVIACGEAAWEHRLEIESEPLFGWDWNTGATVPSGMYRPDDPAAHVAERDLSVQLSGWMAMEAAARAGTVV